MKKGAWKHKNILSNRSIWSHLSKYDPQKSKTPEKKKQKNLELLKCGGFCVSIGLLMCICGCSFTREFNIKAGANGAKAKQYGELQEGELAIQTVTNFTFGCQKQKNQQD